MPRIHSSTLVLAILAVAPCCAQTTEALITGVISESDGTPIDHAQVAYSNPALSISGTAYSSKTGRYSLPLLPPGTYRLRVTQPDHQPQEIQELELNVASRLEVNFSPRKWSDLPNPERTFSPFGSVILHYYAADVESVKPVSIRLQPSTTAPLQSSISEVTTGRDLRDLPLAGGDAYTLLVLQPAVTADTTTARGLGFAVNGQRPSSSNYLLDGIENNNFLVTGPLTAVSPEAIQEYRVSISSFSAEFGGTSGFLANAITRAGGSSWHGIGYFNLKNDALDANDFQSNLVGQARTPLKENQYGFHIGGPILPGRLFASFSYERLRSRSYQDPMSITVPAPHSLDSFPDSSLARKLLIEFPTPATQSQGVTSRIQVREPVALDRYFGTNRLDYSPCSRVCRFFARVAVNHLSAPDFIWSPYKDFISPLDQPLTGLALGYIGSPNSSIANEFRFGWSRYTTRWDRPHPEIPTLIISNTLRPDNVVAGANPTVLPGSLAFYGFRQTSQDWQANDVWTWLTGHHIVKAGGGFLFRDIDGLLTAGRDGNYLFDTIGDFRATSPSTFQVSIDRNSLPGLATPQYDRAYRMRQYSSFVEDTWKVAPRLVINGGVRYENFGSPQNTGINQDTQLILGSGTSLSARLQNATLLPPQSGSTTLYPTRNNFAVRAGASYALNSSSKTLLRGGFGIFYDRPFDNSWLNVANNSFITANFYCNPPITCGNYLNSVTSVLPGFKTQGFATDFPGLTAIDPQLRTAYSRNYFAGVQQELPDGWFAEVNVLGAFGRDLITTDVINRAGNNGRLRPSLPDVSYRGNQGFSDYNALTLLARRRWRRGYLQIAYTWSHTIDNQSDPLTGDFFNLNIVNFSQRAPLYNSGAGFAEQFNSAADRGNSNFDQRQNLVFYSYWDLPSPVGPSKAALLMRNWSVAAVGAFRTGFPFTVYAPSTGAIFNQRADVINPGSTLADRAATGGVILLNPAGFQTPSDGVLGNSGRNAFPGPGLYNIDVSASRVFPLRPLGDGGRLTLRADFFNALNHANLNNPSSLLNSSTFGSAQYGRLGYDSGFPSLVPLNETARQIQLILRLEF